ncbi:MAG: hypothetical protein ABIG44_03725 [Planctomycetota bacterium]
MIRRSIILILTVLMVITLALGVVSFGKPLTRQIGTYPLDEEVWWIRIESGTLHLATYHMLSKGASHTTCESNFGIMQLRTCTYNLLQRPCWCKLGDDWHTWVIDRLRAPRLNDRPGTYQMTTFTMALWLPFILFGVSPAIALISNPIRRYRRRKRGFCVPCGYNLTGNVSGICPECGEARCIP